MAFTWSGGNEPLPVDPLVAVRQVSKAVTLRVVIDNTNVETIPVGNLMDIGGMARRFADQLDANEYGDVLRTVKIVETGAGLTILGWGENTTAYELMGMFEAAKLRVFADDAFADD